MSNNNKSHSLRFSVMDSLFLREGRNYEDVGGLPVASQKLPSLRTLYGAVRARLWELLPAHERKNIIGDSSDDAPQLRMSALRLSLNDKVYVPCPRDIALLEIAKESASPDGTSHEEIRYFEPGEPVLCDVGNTETAQTKDVSGNRPHYFRMPELAGSDEKTRDTSLSFVSTTVLQQWLNHEPVHLDQASPTPDFIELEEILLSEVRLGVALEGRQVKEGQLYQTEHLRFSHQYFGDLQFEVDIYGLSEPLLKQLSSDYVAYPLQRLGADGRSVAAQLRSSNPCISSFVHMQPDAEWVVVTLLSPAIASSTYGCGYLPVSDIESRFEHGANESAFVGDLDIFDAANIGSAMNVKVEQVSAIVDRPQFDSGWDMAGRKPRESRQVIPAGSCFYLRATDDLLNSLTSIQSWQAPAIGKLTHMGFGAIAIKTVTRKSKETNNDVR
ncbi:hypothetical protein KIH87_08540 [Paraneptunicella aestuarii]|uniref:type III-B CRISPR module-associated Cmr3 family protein n=1 Tax=Paraneptunicella aestuarii TaxID=2831148 RepID=UPI001E47C38C|nr:type III-B CRISPR module-associated Cmr3 family protein [Paraneptunicella aestuarii]UAA40366.1 hypothetical protein KIH87_08540 [Paraneptunicella aestuarii]